MRSELLLVHRILETGQERLLSADEVSQVTLDALQPRLAEALRNNLVVTIPGGFWLRSKVDYGILHARVWNGNEPQGTAQIAMAVSRTNCDGVPVLEVSRAGLRASVGKPDRILEMNDLVQRLAWCWLLRFAGAKRPDGSEPIDTRSTSDNKEYFAVGGGRGKRECVGPRR